MSKFAEFLKNSGNLGRILAATITAGGVVFQMGKLSQRVDDILPRANALEREQSGIKDTLYEIHGKICRSEEKLNTIEKDISMIEQDVKYIKDGINVINKK